MKLSDRTRLTGKASFDFLIKHGHIGHLQDSVQNALIVDWFDSVGIYITVDYSVTVSKSFWCNSFNDAIFKSRTEATNAAILKANELYNSENK